MQWPPTKPGLKGKKFHFVDAASKTSFELISKCSRKDEYSFTIAILASLWIFSINFAASATLVEVALNVRASIILHYSSSISFIVFGDSPEIIFWVFTNVLTLSPGFILSGL